MYRKEILHKPQPLLLTSCKIYPEKKKKTTKTIQRLCGGSKSYISLRNGNISALQLFSTTQLGPSSYFLFSYLEERLPVLIFLISYPHPSSVWKCPLVPKAGDTVEVKRTISQGTWFCWEPLRIYECTTSWHTGQNCFLLFFHMWQFLTQTVNVCKDPWVTQLWL